jgi:tetratricopeptide (TPR) repeat protein
MLFKDMDNAAHLGGFVVGICAAVCVLPAQPGMNAWRKVDFIRALGLTAGIIASFLLVTNLDSRSPKVAGEHAYAKAISLLKNYDPAGSIPYLDTALQYMPENAAVYLDRAAAYGMLKMHEKSIADLNEALRLDPKNKKGYFERAARFHSMGDERNAIADIDRVLLLDQKTIVAYSNRAWYYNVLNEQEHAIADSTTAISMDPSSPWAYDTRGVAYCLSGKYNEAIGDFDNYLLLKSKKIRNGAIYYHRAFAYYKLGKTELARQDLAAARQSIYKLEPCEQQWFKSMLSEL